MEELVTLEDLFKDFKMPEPEFCAIYDTETGAIKSIGPTVAFADAEDKIIIDKELALDIIENRIDISNCYIDFRTKKPVVTELKFLRKIDDVLHRVPDTKWVEFENFDVHISYNCQEKVLKFRLSDTLGGTKETEEPAKITANLVGDSIMDFIITEYNDPHVVYEHLKFSIDQLRGRDCLFENLDIPDRFSIYTGRLFENYVLEII